MATILFLPGVRQSHGSAFTLPRFHQWERAHRRLLSFATKCSGQGTRMPMLAFRRRRFHWFSYQFWIAPIVLLYHYFSNIVQRYPVSAFLYPIILHKFYTVFYWFLALHHLNSLKSTGRFVKWNCVPYQIHSIFRWFGFRLNPWLKPHALTTRRLMEVALC